MKECECKRCGYKWHSRRDMPVSCPKCKSYVWWLERGERVAKTLEVK